MKVICDREKLLSAFQMAALVAPTRSPKEILRNVKLEAASDKVVLVATDMEVSLRSELDGIEVEASGSVLLPVDRFSLILRESSDEKLSIEVDPQGTTIKGQHSEFHLPGADPAEFPTITAMDDEKYHEIPARLLKELIRRTLFATDTESNRYALGGVLLELEDSQITAVATDGRRLAKMAGPAHSVGGHQTGDTTTIIPNRAMQLIERAVTDGDAEVKLTARSNDVLVRTARTTIYSRLVEGRFPKWRDVFPRRTDATQIELTVGPLYAALKQAAIVTSTESLGIDFTFAEGSLVLTGSAAERGTSRVELPVAYDGPPLSILLNHRFLADFLKVLDPDKNFTLELEDAEAAALLTTDDGYGYVVMPLARER